jgi:hypothetical protein
MFWRKSKADDGGMYRAGNRSPRRLLRDFEDHKLDGSYKGNTTDYLHAAITVRAAVQARFWAIVAASAAVVSVGVSVAALIKAG